MPIRCIKRHLRGVRSEAGPPFPPKTRQTGRGQASKIMSCSLGHQVSQVMPMTLCLNHKPRVSMWHKSTSGSNTPAKLSAPPGHLPGAPTAAGSVSSAATTLRHNPKLPFCSFILVSTPISTAQITRNVRFFLRLSHVTLEMGTASPTRLLRLCSGLER